MPMSLSSVQQAHGSSRPAVARWLDNNEDSRLPQRLASDSTIVNHRTSRTNLLGRCPSSIGTSQDVNISYASTINSLPAMTRAPTVSTSPSVDFNMTSGELDRSQRMLVPDSTAGGALVTDIPRHIPLILECPFDFIGCLEEFPIDGVQLWLEHTLSHFRKRGRNMKVSPPRMNTCRMCEVTFAGTDGQQSWICLMKHVASAHHNLGHRLAHARPDFDLIRYLWQTDIISQDVYISICASPTRRNTLSRNISRASPALGDQDDDPIGPVVVVHEPRSRTARR